MSISVIAHEGGCGAARNVPFCARPLLAISGSLFALIGVILAASGALAPSDGSTFYMLSGFGLILSGILLARRHIAGAWAYMIVLAGTTIWALRDVGLGGSSLLYRLIGPMIMLLMICALMPALRNWGRAKTIGVCASLTIGIIAIGLIAGGSGANARTPSPQTPVLGVPQ